jgi:ribosomal protein S18 acetylase RimI-like enzyme
MNNDYVIRRAAREEFDLAVEWAAKEGWNPGLYDVDTFYATDTHGFYVGLIDGKLVSSISVVAYDDTFGFLGFYIVTPEYRHQGYGIQIWNQALTHLPTQNIGLDGVVAEQGNYRKAGFNTAYRNIRYEGTGSSDKETTSNNVILLADVPFKQLLDYDNALFPTSRPNFLKLWITQPESLAVGYMEGAKLLGYGVVRKCRSGFKIGPLFADNQTIADCLFQKLGSFAGSAVPMYLDAPEPNKDAIQLAETYGMTPMFETARMYTKGEPGIELNKVFGVTTFELG